LKEENMEKELFTHIDILSKEIKENTFGIDNIMKLDEGIKEFLFDIAGSMTNPEDMSK
jgi:hypothetical protein